MNNEDLLKNERIERELSPHPLSFMRYQSLAIFLLVWGVVLGWLINFSEYSSLFNSNEWYPIMVWGIVLLVFGVIASLLTIRWSIFFLYLAVFLGGIGVMLWQN